MLQPALKHPALTPPAQALTQTAAATYGALIDSAREALSVAIAVSGSRLSAETGAEELRGYERYLNTAGNHLTLLATLAYVDSDATRHLAHRMTRRQIRDAATGAWYDAASALGAAHDLIATHLTDGVPRTVEANQRLLGPAAAEACRNLTEMLLDAVEGSRLLMARIQAAQKRRADRPVPTATFRRLQLTNQAISLCVRATMWDLARVPPGSSVDLHALQVALSVDVARSAAVRPSSPLAALRVIGQLCHDQARGLAAASPASLRDLALLGARVNDPALLEPPGDDRPLARLNRAHAVDQIHAARDAWTAAAVDLTTTIQGLTKAPGSYGAAIGVLLNEPLETRTRAALGRALPALGRDAARTVEAMTERGDLVTLQPVLLQPRNTWRPITPDQATALAGRFEAASAASSRAIAAVRDVNGDRPIAELPTVQSAKRERALDVEEDHGLAAR